MAYCPSCGATVGDEQRFCQGCGATLAGQADPASNAQRGEVAPTTTRDGAEGDVGNTGRSTGTSGTRQPPDRAPSDRSPDGDASGLSRRRLLAFGGGLAVLGVGGAAGYVVLSDGGGPTETVRSYLQALKNGHTQRANSLRHGEASGADASPLALPGGDPSTVEIRSLQVESEPGDRATVTAEIGTTGAASSGSGEATTLVVVVRKQNGQWRVWGWGPAGTSRAFVTAVERSEAQQARRLLHGDASMGVTAPFGVPRSNGASAEIRSIDVSPRSEGRADVDVELGIVGDPLGGDSPSTTVRLELRNEADHWRIWGRGPIACVRAFVEALNRGDAEGATALLHEDANTERITPSQVALFEDTMVSVRNAEVVSQNESVVKVDFELAANFNGNEQTSQTSLTLRTQDDKWRVGSF